MTYVKDKGRVYRTTELATWYYGFFLSGSEEGRYVIACAKAGTLLSEVYCGGVDLTLLEESLPSLKEENPRLVFVVGDIESLYSSLQKFALERVGYVR